MLDLRRLRLLRELKSRGTIAAVADALQFTPSAVSQQLALLERETGVRLLERAGRGVRLTDPALVLVDHADALLDRAALAEADLAAATGTVAGRRRIAGFQSVMLRIALPAMEALARDVPRLRCELVEAEPEDSLPALALGDVDLALGDEWEHQPRRLPNGVERHELLGDPVYLILPAEHPVALRHPEVVPLAELADEAWASGHVGMGWEQMTHRTCRQLGGFDPDIRHRANDATVSLGLITRGLAVALLPDLPLPPGRSGIALRRIAEGSVNRAIFAATRTADAARPSTQALLAAVRFAVAQLGVQPRRAARHTGASSATARDGRPSGTDAAPRQRAPVADA
jgi:DNA-binding transcriptional LysR family regulator